MSKARTLLGDQLISLREATISLQERGYLSSVLYRWLRAVSKSGTRDLTIKSFHESLSEVSHCHLSLLSLIFFATLERSGINPFVFSCLYRYCKSDFLRSVGTSRRLGLIIPTFNRDTRLKQSLEAVLQYQLPFLDVFIHDNNSSDNTEDVSRAIQASYPSRSIHYTKHNSNVGWFRTYLIALAVSSYEYCIISSDDDHLPEETLCFALWAYIQDDALGFLSFDKRLHARNNYPANGLRIAEPGTLDAVLVKDSVNAIGGMSLSVSAFRCSCPDFMTEKSLLAHLSLATAACLRVRCASVSIKEFDPLINAYGNRASSSGTQTDLQVSHIQALINEGSLDYEFYFSSVVRQSLLNIIFRASCDRQYLSHADAVPTAFSGFVFSWWYWIGNRIRTVATDNEGAILFCRIASRFLRPANASNIYLIRDFCDLLGRNPELFSAEAGTCFRRVIFSVFWIKLQLSTGELALASPLSDVVRRACSKDLSATRLEQVTSYLYDGLSLPDFLALWSTDYRSMQQSLALELGCHYKSNLPEIYNECLCALMAKSKPAMLRVLNTYYDSRNWEVFCSHKTLQGAANDYKSFCHGASETLWPNYE